MNNRKGKRKQAVRVCLVEHHPLAADRLREILRRERRLQVSQQSDMQAAHGCPGAPSVVVADVETIPRPVETWLSSLRSERGEARIIAIGHPLDDEQTCRLLLSGVHGFVPYENVDKDLNRAIKSVWEGRFWVNQSVLERLVQHARVVSRPDKGHREPFTAREKEILRLLARQLCNKEIAAEIGIRERTVRFHLANIFSKLGVHDRYSVVDLLKAGEVSAEVD